jgi:hypothetical protein
MEKTDYSSIFFFAICSKQLEDSFIAIRKLTSFYNINNLHKLWEGDINSNRKNMLFHETGLFAGFYTDISCLGGVFAKNTSRQTKNFPNRMAREI